MIVKQSLWPGTLLFWVMNMTFFIGKKRYLNNIRIALILALMLCLGVTPAVEAQAASGAAGNVGSAASYAGSAAVVVNNNVPGFGSEDIVATSYEQYGSFDSLGRCTAAIACVGQDIMPTEERGSIGSVKPTGWNQNKYPGIVDSEPPYLYNRCHLIGYQLTGENANERNLITGTRYLNVEGMLPYENKVANYVSSTGNHVIYRVTPVFTGNNLLCDGVQMEAYSVEDSGAGICFNVFCYNVQPGVKINYSDGSNTLDDGFVVSYETETDVTSDRNISAEDNTVESGAGNAAEDTTVASSANVVSENTQSASYIANKNTKKFHYPSCSSVADMKESNKLYYEGSRDDLVNQGYSPCKRCNP